MLQLKRWAAISGILRVHDLVGGQAGGRWRTTPPPRFPPREAPTWGSFPRSTAKARWPGPATTTTLPGLYLYSNGKVKQLTNNPDIQNFDINDLGQVVWSGLVQSPYGYNIFLYKNGGTTPITTNGNNNFDPSFNANGDFVWHSYDGVHAYVNQCTSAGAVSTIWTCTSYSVLNANANFINPVINNLRQVAWIIITQDASYNLWDNIYLL